MNLKVIFLLSLYLLAIYAQTCPNDCSGHGTCTQGVCQCRVNYAGADCSIYQHPLSMNEWTEGQVEIWNWRFYTFNAGFGAGNLRWEVESLDDEGDCDLYIRKGEKPTRLEWDFKDTDTSADAVLDVENAAMGTWYAGVFGFYPCHYRIRVTALGTCNVPCGAHGTCQNGVCVCNRGWAGTGCTESDSTMTMGRLYTGAVAEDEWKFYRLSLNQQYSAVLVSLNQTGTGENQDCDLYARFGELPSQYEWDYFDQNWRETYSAVNLAEPQQGDWFIGVYGYSACEFKIRADESTGCPNQCSKRGSCQAGQCRCQIGYVGTACEENADPILLGQSLSGFVEYLTWNFFKINTDSQANLIISVTQDSASADCDIYVRRQSRPTATEYDYYDVSYQQSFSVTVPNPGVEQWWIGIFGASYDNACSYTLTTSTSTACTGCENGECLDFGYCVCNEGYAGEACNYAITPLTNAVAVTSTIAPRTWNYYSLKSSASTITVSLKETSTIGYIWLYSAMEISPTLRYYDDQDIDTDSGFHTITIDASFWSDGEYEYTYIFGVYGSPLTARDVEYTIAAWETPFK